MTPPNSASPRIRAAVLLAALGLLILPAAPSEATDVTNGGTGHESGVDGGAAPWPEWARTGSPTEDHTNDSSPSGSAAATSGPDSDHATHDDHTADTGEGVPSPDTGSSGRVDQGHDTGGHGEETGPTQPRPRALVLGSFAAGNTGVLLTAAFMRRRTRPEVQRRKSARAAAVGDTAHKRSRQSAAPAQAQS